MTMFRGYKVSSNVSGENREVEKGVRHFAKGIISKTCSCNMQQFLKVEKNDNFNMIFFNIFLISTQQGGSNEYQQSTFWSKNKKKICIPL